ncbi:helix-turn-helix domain-containing protein [Pseudomonas aeruginosa]|uniref:helix-turn-helix domain-containing protein n=1 Tax=Pseudomonas aeruginosa TaxID=287 RepID=UPI0039762060
MELKDAFGQALRQFRKSKEMTQEDFSQISSRTYLSTLERGLKSPTLDKIDEISRLMGIHPVTAVAGTYLKLEGQLTLDQLLSRIRLELQSVAENDSDETPSGSY